MATESRQTQVAFHVAPPTLQQRMLRDSQVSEDVSCGQDSMQSHCEWDIRGSVVGLPVSLPCEWDFRVLPWACPCPCPVSGTQSPAVGSPVSLSCEWGIRGPVVGSPRVPAL